MFQLMEPDLISLKGSTVSSSRFWGVYGFSMSLGSPSGFGSVRHIYFCSRIKVTESAYLHCHQPPVCPWNLCQCSCPLALPCTASWRLPGRGLCGSFLSSLALPSASWRPVWASLSPLSLPSVSQGMCALASAHWACPLYRGTCCTCFGSPGQPLCHGACVHMFLFSGPALCTASFVCSEFHVWIPQVSWHPGLALCTWGFCGLLLVPWACCLVGATVHELFMGWEVQLSLFSALEVLCFALDSTTPPWAPLWGSLPVLGNLFLLHDSFPWGPNSHLEVLRLFPFYVSIFSPTSFQGA